MRFLGRREIFYGLNIKFLLADIVGMRSRSIEEIRSSEKLRKLTKL